MVTARCPLRAWNFQLNNHWMESLDYRYHRVHTNSSLARADEGEPAAFTLIVAHRDPNPAAANTTTRSRGKGSKGFKGNWINTVGHSCGTMCFRYIAPEVGGGHLLDSRRRRSALGGSLLGRRALSLAGRRCDAATPAAGRRQL